jgi:DNA polymerase-3 subunit gamma/tau
LAVSYQVFARKYRPQIFDDVVGQEHITRTLKNAIAQNRLAHAYLFVGPRGIGKTSTARILAKALCCIHAPTSEPCGVCDPCREIAAGNSLDVLEIDGASNNGVEQVRELRDNVRYAPSRGQYKIYIIDEVHMLTAAAFNALLKTLEEPPEHVKFIFATTEPQKVLATILSRCQRFDLRRIPAPLIAGHLQKIAGLEQIELAPEAADAIARGAEGGLRDAESMLDQLVAFCGGKIVRADVLSIFGFTGPEVVAELAGAVLDGSAPAALAVLDAQSEAGKDLLRLLGELISHLRNLLVAQVDAGSVAAEAAPGMQETVQAQAARIAPDRLLELIDQFAVAENRMKWAPNKKLHFEIALIKAIQTLGQATLSEVIDALAVLRHGENGAVPAALAPSRVVEAAKPDFAGLKKSVAAPPPREVAPIVTKVEPVKEPIPSPVPAALAPAPQAVLPPPPPPEPVRIAETAPLPPAPAPPAATAKPDLDGEKIWRALIEEIRTQRPLITTWVQSGHLLSAQAGTLRVGFPASQKMVVESLGKPNNRKLLETLLTKLAGTPVTLQLELQDREDDPPPPSDAGGAPTVSGPAGRTPNGSGPATEARNGPVGDPADAFKNDPLIQRALKIFEGEIRSVEGPNEQPAIDLDKKSPTQETT